MHFGETRRLKALPSAWATSLPAPLASTFNDRPTSESADVRHGSTPFRLFDCTLCYGRSGTRRRVWECPPASAGLIVGPYVQTSSIPPARPFLAQRVVPLSRPSPNMRTSIRSPSTKLHLALTQKPAFERFRSVPWTIAPSPRAILQGSLVETRSGRFGNSLIVRFRPRPAGLGHAA
jgi:hypothetical protein